VAFLSAKSAVTSVSVLYCNKLQKAQSQMWSVFSIPTVSQTLQFACTSLLADKILAWKRAGKISHCQHIIKPLIYSVVFLSAKPSISCCFAIQYNKIIFLKKYCQ